MLFQVELYIQEKIIMMEILKHGSHVEVLGPEWLRDKLREEVLRTAQRYE